MKYFIIFILSLLLPTASFAIHIPNQCPSASIINDALHTANCALVSETSHGKSFYRCNGASIGQYGSLVITIPDMPMISLDTANKKAASMKVTGHSFEGSPKSLGFNHAACTYPPYTQGYDLEAHYEVAVVYEPNPR